MPVAEQFYSNFVTKCRPTHDLKTCLKAYSQMFKKSLIDKNVFVPMSKEASKKLVDNMPKVQQPAALKMLKCNIGLFRILKNVQKSVEISYICYIIVLISFLLFWYNSIKEMSGWP